MSGMNKKTKLIGGAVAATAVIGVAAGVGFAGGSDDERSLRGSNYDRATAAALEHVGEGTVIEAEPGDGDAAYEVGVRLDDGSEVEVHLDSDFDVIDSARDDDGAGEESGAEDD
jgi:hypothetical protein